MIKPTVYTEDVMDAINTFCTEEMTLSEIYEALSQLFPTKGITSSNLCTKLNRLKIKYKHSEKRGRPKKSNKKEKISTKTKQNDIVEINAPQPTPKMPPAELSNSLLSEIQKDDLLRTEMDEVLDKKFRRLNCKLERDYTTDEYIKFLDMLLYLTSNYEEIIHKRQDQHDIMNAFQSDVLHEIENTDYQQGDTYLQDKLRLLRRVRRYYEYDREDITILKPLISNINTDLIASIIRSLNNIKHKRQAAYFIPLVDDNMAKKYDWCKSGNLSSTKLNQPILVTNAKNKHRQQSDNRKKYRVTCKISGGGYGAYKSWHKDFSSTTRNEALASGLQFLEQLKITKPGIVWSELSCHELNI